jgi:hypothetical protein
MSAQGDQQQEALRKAFDARQDEIDAAAKRILAERGPDLEKQAAIHESDLSVIPDPAMHKAAAEEMAHIIAERGVQNGNFSLSDYRDVPAEAVQRAEAARDEREQGVEPPAQDPTSKSELSTEHREATQDRAANREIGTYADLTREHSEIVARLEAGEDLDAGEKKLRFFEDHEQENARAIGDDKGRPELSTQEQSEPGEKRLRFYGELKDEHARNAGGDNDRAEGQEKEQGDAGQKTLRFFEDRDPTQEHGMEH